jgi:hypothetical protein
VDEVRSYLVGRPAMNDPKRRAVKFLEKEIRTYKALSIFFFKEGHQGARARRREEGLNQSDILRRTHQGSNEDHSRSSQYELGSGAFAKEHKQNANVC